MKTRKNKDLNDVFGSPRLRCVYEPIDADHPLIPHAGLDDNGRPTLIFFYQQKPYYFLCSSEVIDCRIRSEPAGHYTVSYSLHNKQYYDDFVSFCYCVMTTLKDIENNPA